MAAAEPAAQQQQEAPWWQRIGQMMMMYYMFSMAKNMFMPAATTPEASVAVNPATPAATPVESPDLSDPLNSVPSFKAGNLWRNHQPFYLDVFVSPNQTADLSTLSADIDPLSGKVWHKDFTYDWENQSLDMFGQEPLPNEEFVDLAKLNPHWLPMMANNQSLYAHAIMRMKGVPMSPKERGYLSWGLVHASAPLTTYQNAPKKKKSLLSTASTSSTDEQPIATVSDTQDEPGKILFLIPDITVRVLHDFTVFTTGSGSMTSIPPELRSFYNVDIKAKGYTPVAYIDRFWTLPDTWVPVNNTLLDVAKQAAITSTSTSTSTSASASTPSSPPASMILPVRLGFQPTSLVRWRIQEGMKQSWNTQKDMGVSSDKETADFKRMILETQPWLLVLTVVVSTFHMLFDFLAFKNDIAFWKNNKDTAGLSFRTIILNLISQTIIFFYLLDNETSWMILLSNGMAVLIEGWKITKAADVTLLPSFPYISIKEHGEDSETAEHDRVAFKYLSITLVPLVLGYSVYTLLYEEHTSWYSWALATLVGTVYTFGFIGMCPQLYLNYKLQSVAHLPWKMLTYKALNTFIDDIFAFVIKMPTLHRIACLRDDLIFVIFLYQKWHYRTDYSRVNEFGVSFEAGQDENKVENKEDEDAVKKIDDKSKKSKNSGDKDVVMTKEDSGDDDEVEEVDATVDSKGEGLRRRAVDSVEDVD